MFLSSEAIRSAEEEGGVRIVSAQTAAKYRTASRLLHLGERIRRWVPGAGNVIRIDTPDAASPFLGPIEDAKEFIVLRSGEFLLAQTDEAVGISEDYVALILPLSHIARFGISTTNGAALVSPGYSHGTPTPLTLELHNKNRYSISLPTRSPICHLLISRVSHSIRSTPSEVSAEMTILPPRYYEQADPLISPGYQEDLLGDVRTVD